MFLKIELNFFLFIENTFSLFHFDRSISIPIFINKPIGEIVLYFLLIQNCNFHLQKKNMLRIIDLN